MIIALAKEKRSQLERESIKNDEAINLLSILSGECAAPLPNDYRISYTQQPERLLLCQPTRTSENEIEDAFEALYHALEIGNTHPIGLPLLLSGFENESAPYHVGVSVQHEMISDKLIYQTLPSGWYLSTFHYGGYDIRSAFPLRGKAVMAHPPSGSVQGECVRSCPMLRRR